MRLKITPAAREDLSDILVYTEQRWGLEQRKTYQQKLEQAILRLLVAPAMGSPRQELSDGLRTVRVGNHNVYYWADEKRVTIARLLHQRQDLTSVDWPALDDELDEDIQL
jgi:toxin ParE1/3/4